jgi:hypothetical protein
MLTAIRVPAFYEKTTYSPLLVTSLYLKMIRSGTRSVCDHAKFKTKRPFFNSIIWFIFNLQTKNLTVRIAAEIYVQK